MGAGPQTSLWTNLRGLEARKTDLLKVSLCIFPLRQCLQWFPKLEIESLQLTVLLQEERAVQWTLSLGWPSLWCQTTTY